MGKCVIFDHQMSKISTKWSVRLLSRDFYSSFLNNYNTHLKKGRYLHVDQIKIIKGGGW